MSNQVKGRQETALGNIKKIDLSWKQLGMLSLIAISILLAIVLVKLPFKFQAVLIAAIPAFLFIIVILIDANLGIYYYFLWEYFRPVDIIPALGPLKIAMLIELLTLIAWIFYLIKSREKIIWFSFNYYYIAFILLAGITIFTAHNNRFAFNTTQALVVNFVIFLIATNIVDTEKRLEKLIWLLLLTHFYHALKGLYNFAVVGYVAAGQRTSGEVGSSFMGDENDFALALNVMIPFAFFYFQQAKTFFKKYFNLGMLLTFVLGVVSSMSRGGWVGLMAIVFICIMKSKRKLMSFTVVGAFAVIVFIFAPSNYWSEVRSISDTSEATAQTRIRYWKAGVAMMIDNPVFGVGASNGPVRMQEYVHGFRNNATQWGRTFHGTLPQVMGELGMPGIAIYLLMIFFALKILHRVEKQTRDSGDENINIISNAIFTSIIGYIVTATFLSTAYYPQLWTLYAFTIILFNISKRTPGEERLSTVISEVGAI